MQKILYEISICPSISVPLVRVLVRTVPVQVHYTYQVVPVHDICSLFFLIVPKAEGGQNRVFVAIVTLGSQSLLFASSSIRTMATSVTSAIPPPPSRVAPLYHPTSQNSGAMENAAALASAEPNSLCNRPRDWRNMTRTIAHYERIEQIGEGTYGQVYRARCKDTNEIVALKKIRVHHGGYWGMPPTVIREIKILKRLRHPNLVQMVEVVSSKGVEHLDEEDEVSEKHKSSKTDRVVDAREGFKGNLFLVLEYVSHDLTGLMDVAYRFSEVQVKCIFRQLLEALHYMHENKYVHRDIKSSNILIDHNFKVKLADFGLARCLEPPILDKIHEYVNNNFMDIPFAQNYAIAVYLTLHFSVFLSLS
jgi:serine/threonine protein kinase